MAEKSDRWLSLPTAAGRLGISPQTLQKMIDDKEIAAMKVHGRWKIRESTVEQYQEEHSNVPDQKKDNHTD